MCRSRRHHEDRRPRFTGLALRGLVVLVLVCLGAAGVAQASQPVTVDFTAHGTATFNAQMSPGSCNGAAIYATVTDAIPFSWETKFNTTINNDETIVDEPGYLVGHDFAQQSANVVGSGGDGGTGCSLAVAMITSCPTDVQADIASSTPPALSDPDRAAQQPLPLSYENVDVQGPLYLGDGSPAARPTIGCGLAFNDLSMLNASLPAMFTAHFQLPHDIFYDPKTGTTRDSWSTDVSMPSSSPVDGSACAAGNNNVSYIYCSKAVSWSGTITITPRADDCSEGATAPPAGSQCPPVKPVLPYSTVTAITGPSGPGATFAGATGRGSVPVSVTVSGAGSVSGSLSATVPGGSGGARDARVKHIVIARGHATAHRRGRVTLKLKLTRAGRALLRSWKRRTLSTKLAITVSSKNHRTTATRTIKLRRH